MSRPTISSSRQGLLLAASAALVLLLPAAAEDLATAVPTTPNPYLSFLPTGVEPDYATWRPIMERRAAERRLALPVPERTVAISESEPNDSQATADSIPGFGTGAGEDPAADVSGTFLAPAAPVAIGPFAEDEGSIPLASDTGLTAGSAVTISGTIGDGPFGSGGTGSGDLDFFRIPGVARGQLIVIDVDTPTGNLDTFIALMGSDGGNIRLNEDEDTGIEDSFIAVPAPADDDYYVSIGGSLDPFASVLLDPFDSSSGFGVGSEGDYVVTISLEYGDPDWFSFELDTCDILGVNLLDAGNNVQVRSPSGDLLVASAQDLSGAYPASSPLPGGGNAVLAFVASESGTYAVRALGADGAPYTLELRLFRQPLEATTTPKRIFIDFDGATFDTSVLPVGSGIATLSPLSSFLTGWGLGPGDEDAVIDAILETVEENLGTDPATQGPNGAFAAELLNSRDHPDPFGAPDVSRLIVGGTIPELGIPTIGIAQSIDPGNFDAAETAVILLDLLSRPPPEPDSLNTFPLAPGVDIIDLVGVAVGNIVAHEAGHYIGNFHTEQFDGGPESIMDQGGNLPNTIGVGADGIFGNADDVDVDFGADVYADTEGFAGVEDTLTLVSCGCTITPQVFADGFESGGLGEWSSTSP